MEFPKFVRRLGPKSCFKTEACPDVILLSDGSFAIIGLDITAQSKGNLPEGTGCGESERVVRIPRQTLLQAIADIGKA